MNYRIQDLNKDEKPREKLINLGPSVLTESELIALLLGTGGKQKSALDLARELLTKHDGIEGLADIPIEQLLAIKNISKAKACAIKAAMEIGLRVTSPASNLQKQEITKPSDVFSLLKKQIYKKNKEHLFLISLNSRNKLIATDLISLGTINEALISPSEIFKQALIRNAVAIILAHNHPSNDPNPSDSDLAITYRIAKCGQDLGIPLVDHIILASSTFISLKATNLLDEKNSQKKGGDNCEKN